MNIPSPRFGAHWWADYYTEQMSRAIDSYSWKRKMGMATESDLSKSNEEIYEAIKSRDIFLSMIENQQAREEEEFYSTQ